MLANFCMAVAAIVLGARRFNDFYYLGNYICQDSSSDRWYKSFNTPVPEEADRRGLCIFYISMLRVSGHGDRQVQIVAGRPRWAREGTPSAEGAAPPYLGDCS